MQLTYSPYMLLPLVALLMAIILAYRAWRYRASHLATTFLVLMLALAWWSLAALLENVNPSLSAKIFWIKMAYPGIVILPLAWLIFTLQYTNREKLVTRGRIIVFAILPVLTLVMVWTNNIHHLMWTNIWLDTSFSRLLMLSLMAHGIGSMQHIPIC